MSPDTRPPSTPPQHECAPPKVPSCRQRLTGIGLTSDGTVLARDANLTHLFSIMPLTPDDVSAGTPHFPAVRRRFIEPGRSADPIVAVRSFLRNLSARCRRRRGVGALCAGKTAYPRLRWHRESPFECHEKTAQKHSEQHPQSRMAILRDHCHRIFGTAENASPSPY